MFFHFPHQDSVGAHNASSIYIHTHALPSCFGQKFLREALPPQLETIIMQTRKKNAGHTKQRYMLFTYLTNWQAFCNFVFYCQYLALNFFLHLWNLQIDYTFRTLVHGIFMLKVNINLFLKCKHEKKCKRIL